MYSTSRKNKENKNSVLFSAKCNKLKNFQLKKNEEMKGIRKDSSKFKQFNINYPFVCINSNRFISSHSIICYSIKVSLLYV